MTGQASDLGAGSIIAGKYRIEKLLGSGGMGIVMAAHHLQLDERVAIKFLLPEALSNEEAVVRFHQEARAAVKIKSEHVARVIDVGTLDDGGPYIVMEYLEGEDLSTWLTARGRLSSDQAIEFLLQACEALAEAHKLGIIHRDLKPANLFCIQRPDGVLSIKVLDFGISKMPALGGSSDHGMTQTKNLMGSPFYMSPEQMRSARNVDRRTDIWALGVILFELLAGKPPFTGETLTELVLGVANGEPDDLAAIRPDVPLRLISIVRRCLEKDREKRFPTVAELALALGEFGPVSAQTSVERISRLARSEGPVSSDEGPVSSDEGRVLEATLHSLEAGGVRAARRRTSSAPRARRRIAIAAAAFAVSAVVGVSLGRIRASQSMEPTHSMAAASFVVPLLSPAACEEKGSPGPATESVPRLERAGVDPSKPAKSPLPVATYTARSGRAEKQAPPPLSTSYNPLEHL